MRVEVLTDDRAFAKLQPDWDRLAGAPGRLGPFVGYAWQFEWWKALGGGRSLRLLVARDDGRVRGILPLYEERTAGIRRFSLMGSAGGGSDFLDALADDDRTRQGLVEAALGLQPDLIDLLDLEAGSPLLPVLRRLASARGGEVREVPRYPCPYISIRSEWETFLASHPRRENLRRRRKWFASQPGFRIDCETTPEAVPSFLARFYRLHAARWREDGGSQAFADPRLIAFHNRIATRYADEGRLRLWTLSVARQPLAVAYTFDDGERTLFYQSGFEPAWRSRSVGLVLFAAFIEDAFRRGQREVDLLRGAEAYKTEWTGETRQTVAFRWAISARGRLALATEAGARRLREGVRAALPRPLKQTLSIAVREARMKAGAVA